LEDGELAKVAASAWKYEVEGKNFVGKEQRVFVTKSELEAYGAHKNGGDGLLLFLELRRLGHEDRSEFAISPKAMEAAQIIPGWGVRRYGAARDAGLDVGRIARLHQGGKKKGDASLFAFAKGLNRKGAQEAPNTNTTPL